MKLYSAFDLHSNNSYLAIIDENGKRVFHRKVKNDAQLVVQSLNPFENDIEGIVVESNSSAPRRPLSAAGAAHSRLPTVIRITSACKLLAISSTSGKIFSANLEPSNGTNIFLIIQITSRACYPIKVYVQEQEIRYSSAAWPSY